MVTETKRIQIEKYHIYTDFRQTPFFYLLDKIDKEIY